MALKTVIKRHIKRFDLSIEIATATEADDQAERDLKQESFIEAEFQELAKASEEAEINLQGSRERQEQIAEEKIKEGKGSAPTEEEMEAAMREQLAREQKDHGEPEQQPRRSLSLPRRQS